jgi:hypothetical protein
MFSAPWCEGHATGSHGSTSNTAQSLLFLPCCGVGSGGAHATRINARPSLSGAQTVRQASCVSCRSAEVLEIAAGFHQVSAQGASGQGLRVARTLSLGNNFRLLCTEMLCSARALRCERPRVLLTSRGLPWFCSILWAAFCHAAELAPVIKFCPMIHHSLSCLVHLPEGRAQQASSQVLHEGVAARCI